MQDRLCDVYRQLWERTDHDQATSEELAKRVLEVSRAVEDLKPAPTEAEVTEAERETVGAGAGARTLGKRAGDESVASGANWRDEVRRWADAGRRRRLALWTLAIVLAVATGLNTLYVGKAFGSFWDYTALFLWGVSSKFIVELVANGLDSIGLGGLRAVARR